MKFKDPNLILMCAFRYALGRRTYIVSSVVEELILNWDYLEDLDKLFFKREIKENNNLSNIDKEQWYKILEL